MSMVTAPAHLQLPSPPEMASMIGAVYTDPGQLKDVGIVDAKEGREGMPVPQWRRNFLSHHTI